MAGDARPQTPADVLQAAADALGAVDGGVVLSGLATRSLVSLLHLQARRLRVIPDHRWQTMVADPDWQQLATELTTATGDDGG